MLNQDFVMGVLMGEYDEEKVLNLMPLCSQSPSEEW